MILRLWKNRACSFSWLPYLQSVKKIGVWHLVGRSPALHFLVWNPISYSSFLEMNRFINISIYAIDYQQWLFCERHTFRIGGDPKINKRGPRVSVGVTSGRSGCCGIFRWCPLGVCIHLQEVVFTPFGCLPDISCDISKKKIGGSVAELGSWPAYFGRGYWGWRLKRGLRRAGVNWWQWWHFELRLWTSSLRQCIKVIALLGQASSFYTSGTKLGPFWHIYTMNRFDYKTMT